MEENVPLKSNRDKILEVVYCLTLAGLIFFLVDFAFGFFGHTSVPSSIETLVLTEILGPVFYFVISCVVFLLFAVLSQTISHLFPGKASNSKNVLHLSLAVTFLLLITIGLQVLIKDYSGPVLVLCLLISFPGACGFYVAIRKRWSCTICSRILMRRMISAVTMPRLPRN